MKKGNSLLNLLIQLIKFIDTKYKLQLIFLLFLMILSSIAELLSLAMVIPFLSILSDPDIILKSEIGKQLINNLAINDLDNIVIPITLIFCFFVTLSGLIRLLSIRFIWKISGNIGASLSSKAYNNLLFENYEKHLNRNSSSVISTISIDSTRIVNEILNPILLMISSGLIALTIILGLVIINWLVALFSSLIVLIFYIVVIYSSRKKIESNSQLSVRLNQDVIKYLQEGIGSIRDVILSGSQNYYSKGFVKTSFALRKKQAESNFLTLYPRLVLEPFGILLIALIGTILTIQNGSLDKALPFLGALILGTQRIIPMVQKVYEGISSSQIAKDSLENFLKLLLIQNPNYKNKKLNPLHFTDKISFNNVSFRYSSRKGLILKDLNFTIKKGERVGIIGETGSGKSTTIDLLMGLITPSKGFIKIDNSNLHDKRNPNLIQKWRQSISHVPQNIFLTDSTIIENIAFGIDKINIDYERALKAARLSQLHKFIVNLPYGYETIIGEKGSFLSGGQKQRLGIARSLYRKTEILIFDEATSSLDSKTEESIMNSIDLLAENHTILLIAHRISTLKNCNRILNLKNGTLKEVNFEDLI